MRNSILTIVTILVLTAGNAAAQHFEWVRGFASGENVAIVGSVTDSVGNLYILGSINAYTSWENGSRLMPDIPYSYGDDHGDVLIAKISPDGDLVWYKVIHGNYRKSAPHDIKPLGDTAFACLVSTPLASIDNYLYYLDTLIRPTWNYYDGIPLSPEIPWPDYPLNSKDMYRGYPLALITFDFDGNVLEQHFLHMTYLDRNGEDILFSYPAGANPAHPEPYLYNHFFEYPSFAIDSEGNIYLSHKAYHYLGFPGDVILTVEDGDICAVKFWCDNRVVGIVPTDSTHAFSPQILKFSPHFDTLLRARYVLQNKCPFLSHHLWCDKKDLYYINNLDNHYRNATYIIDSANNLFIPFTSATNRSGFLIRYSLILDAKYVLFMEDSIICPSINCSEVTFHDLAFDSDSNLLFLSSCTGRGEWNDTSSLYSFLSVQDHVLTELKNNAFFISFKIEEDSLLFHSYGVTPSIGSSNCLQSYPEAYGNLACKNNRVFLQSKSYGGARFPNNTLEWDYWQGSLGLTYFDYQGHLIGGINYGAYGDDNRNGPVSLKDNSLYLISKLTSGATFGKINVPSRGRFFACIAKYTDPAFIQPYRPAGIHVVDDTPMSVSPNPATDRVQVSLPVSEPVTAAWVVDLTGRRRPVPVSGHTVDLSAAPSGILILQVATSNHVYNHRIIKL